MCLQTMSETHQSQITMRIPLDRPPTQEDHQAAVGIDLFEERLRQSGWVDGGGNVLKRFHISYEGHAENGQYYIEWKATLRK